MKFKEAIRRDSLKSSSVQIVQVNIGLTCNLSCTHCHVSSSPLRKEQMSIETIQHILEIVRLNDVQMVDITGGAPEMNPHFRMFITELRKLECAVQVRTNLSVMLLKPYTDIPAFYKKHKVQLVASLPCYLEENVDKQRGDGTFSDSIRMLQELNSLGYGIDENLGLDLMYNPGTPSLPANEAELEKAYKLELKKRYNIEFRNLLCLANMPIGQYRASLKREGKFNEYVTLLEDSFNPETVDSLMCRHQINIGWDGTLYDCDFNLALKKPLTGEVRNIHQVGHLDSLKNRDIYINNHCFGCTAGTGSSCGGSLV